MSLERIPLHKSNNRRVRTVGSELQLDVYGPNVTHLEAPTSFPLVGASHHPILPAVPPEPTLCLQPFGSAENSSTPPYGTEGPLFGRLCDELVAHLISFIPSVQDRAAFREVATRWRRIINESPELWRRVSMYFVHGLVE